MAQYMRSVNDYSLSSHEIFTKTMDGTPANNTLILKYQNIRSVESCISLRSEIVKVIEDHMGDNYSMSDYTVGYDFSNNENDSNDTVILEQKFTKFYQSIREGGVESLSLRTKNCIVLETYKRGTEFVVILLSNTPLDWAKIMFENNKKKYYEEEEEVKNLFHTIGKSNYGFELQTMNLDLNYDESIIDTNYNDSFRPVWDTIINSIDDNSGGLILLHGVPGSGKTSALKQVIARGGKRKIIYIPPYLAASLNDPSFVSFVRSNMNNSVLVIEDAEDVLMSRELSTGNAAVSNILNISSGIMGDALNILIIATFNTDLKNIDTALTRKGRCIAEYQFNALHKDKAQKLINAIYGSDKELTKNESTTLANIYNMNKIQPKTVVPEPRKIGF